MLKFGVFIFSVSLLALNLGVGAVISQKLGLRKRWGLLGAAVWIFLTLIFTYSTSVQEFLEPLANRMLLTYEGAGLLPLFIVTSFVALLLALPAGCGTLILLEKKGIR